MTPRPRPAIPRALALASLLAIAACGAAALDAPDTASDPHHGVSTDPLAATGFITTNAPPPETAVEKNGMMRDADGRPYGYELLGKALPAVTAATLDGEAWSTSDIDQWTIVDVWGVWCGDCRADGPYAAQLADTIAQRADLDFISIHTPSSAARAEDAFGTFGSVEAYFDDRGFAYPTAIDADASIREALEIAWTPSYLLVSPEGVVSGFRTDLSVLGAADPVADFLADIDRVRQGETAR